MRLRTRLRHTLRELIGYDIRRTRDPYSDIKSVITTSTPIVFDVGANIGQSIETFRHFFPSAEIHAFEPGSVFSELSKKHVETGGVYLNNVALGSQPGMLEFHENTESDLSSFLHIGPQGRGQTTVTRRVQVKTLNEYCVEHDVKVIDLLKIDTQGFELEVLKGSIPMLEAGRIRAIFLEINFVKLYENLPTLGELHTFLLSKNFSLVSFYEIYYLNNRAAWTDALFVWD